MEFSLFEDLPGVSQMIKNLNGDMADMNIEMPVSNGNRPSFPSKTPLAMAYVPVQQWNRTYDEEQGFKRGTVFPDLDFPFSAEEDSYDTKK